jgi:hypothetical protein
MPERSPHPCFGLRLNAILGPGVAPSAEAFSTAPASRAGPAVGRQAGLDEAACNANLFKSPRERNAYIGVFEYKRNMLSLGRAGFPEGLSSRLGPFAFQALALSLYYAKYSRTFASNARGLKGLLT